MTPPKNDKARKEWLASLKDGEKVAVCDDRDRMRIASISYRAMHRQVFYVTESGQFTVATGKRVGSDAWIIPLTDELRKQIARATLVTSARTKMAGVMFAPWGFNVTGAATDDQALACAAIMWPEEFEGKS